MDTHKDWEKIIQPVHALLLAFLDDKDTPEGTKVWEQKKNELYDLAKNIITEQRQKAREETVEFIKRNAEQETHGKGFIRYITTNDILKAALEATSPTE